MITKIIMPKLGETMEEGIISKWLMREGEKVEKGESLFEVSTDKATFEVESLTSGFLRKIIYPVSETPISVTKVIGYITDSIDEEIPQEEMEEAGKVEEVEEVTKVEEVKETKKTEIKASPVAKRLAREKRIDLSKIKGTGPGGRITEKDVLDFVVEPLISNEGKFETSPIIGIRKIIAERVSKSKREVPHYYLMMEIDMTEIVNIRTKEFPKTSYNSFIIKAVSNVLKDFPQLNSTFEEQSIKIYKEINIGLVVAIQNGLVIPVIKQTEKKSLEQIDKEVNYLIEKARLNKISLDDISGGTFTISNLGMYDIDIFTAIINQPQVGILTVGKIKETPYVSEQKIEICKIMKVCLSLDHRVIDGAYGANFLKQLKGVLEKPLILINKGE